jgi:hypothetical protein
MPGAQQRLWFDLAVGFLGLGILSCAPDKINRDDVPYACIPGDAAWISGIRLGASPQEVEHLLGNPASRDVGFGEDDGGQYEEIELAYPGLLVFLVDGVVDRIVATDPKSCTADGICPGATLQQVRERVLKHSEEFATSDLEDFVLCPEDDFLSDYYLTIDYGPAGQVVNLELVLDRP